MNNTANKLMQSDLINGRKNIWIEFSIFEN